MREPVKDQAHRLREIVAEKRAAGIQPKSDKSDGFVRDATTVAKLLDMASPSKTSPETSIEPEPDAFEIVDTGGHGEENAVLPESGGDSVSVQTETTEEESLENSGENLVDDVPDGGETAESDPEETEEELVEIELSPDQLGDVNELTEVSIVTEEEQVITPDAEVPAKAETEAKEKSSSVQPSQDPKPRAIVVPTTPRKTRIPLNVSTQIYAITSGKGGVGKTNVTCNVALALSRMGKRVMVFDADLSLANVDILLGLTPRYNLGHVVRGEKNMREIVVEAAPGFMVVPGVSGVEELANLSSAEVERLLDGFASLEKMADILLIDTAAGIHQLVMSFLLAADRVIVVTTPEPTAYMDAYALIKVLIGHDREKAIQLIVNMASNEAEGREVVKLLTSMCRQWLGIGFKSLGIIPRDVDVLQSVRHHAPILAHSPHSAAAKRLRYISANLLQDDNSNLPQTGLRAFMSRVLSRMRKAG